MKPSNPAGIGGLTTSIESMLAEIEKSDVPELNAGPNAFYEWIKQPGAVEVREGYMKTAIKDQVIFTNHMADCSSVVLCVNYDENTGIYAERSLMHILGSYVGDSYGVEKSLELIRKASESSGKPRLIFALGSHVTHDQFGTIENQSIDKKYGAITEPLKELQGLCDTTVVARTTGIAVRADGAYVLLRY